MMAQMQYTIGYYSEAVLQDIDSMPLRLRARYAILVERMKHSGSDLGEPHTQAMGSGLFELRLKSPEGIARVMYCTLVGRRIVMLHSFIKKTQKTPMADLALARKRLLEVKNADT
jgi:phage-related protein